MKSSRTRPSQGFTIIEILVVVSIIVLLVAILLPALAGARKNAKKNVCLSNLKAVSEAVTTYQTNNNTYFPGPSYNGSDVQDWNLFGAPGTGSQAGANTAINNRPLNPYLNNATEVAHCPVDVGSDLTGTAKSAWEELGNSYWYPDRTAAQITAGQRQIWSGIWAVEGHRMTEIRQPGLKLVTADLVIRKERLETETRNLWHTSKDPMQVSAAFADGHAQFINRKISTDAGGGNADLANATEAQVNDRQASTREYY